MHLNHVHSWAIIFSSLSFTTRVTLIRKVLHGKTWSTEMEVAIRMRFELVSSSPTVTIYLPREREDRGAQMFHWATLQQQGDRQDDSPM